jgi:ParB-like chromosome segregation protein Spo0J
VKTVLNVQKSKNIHVGDIIARDAERLLPPTETGIKQMAESFQAYGQLHPILVRHVARNTVKLVAGATRLAAAKHLHWNHIRADVITVNDERDYQIIEIEENIERRGLTDGQRKMLREKKRALEI